jgi:hypothetical protein
VPAAPAAPVDPATATFSTDAGLLLVLVKADKVADYENAITALQDAFSKDTNADHRAVATGWRVFKAAEADSKGNVVYVHALLPVVAGTDYRPSLWLDQLLGGAPAELLDKYKNAFAGAPTRLSLTEFAHMAVAPVKK